MDFHGGSDDAARDQGSGEFHGSLPPINVPARLGMTCRGPLIMPSIPLMTAHFLLPMISTGFSVSSVVSVFPL
jgi:hypothetical protein